MKNETIDHQIVDSKISAAEGLLSLLCRGPAVLYFDKLDRIFIFHSVNPNSLSGSIYEFSDDADTYPGRIFCNRFGLDPEMPPDDCIFLGLL